MVRRNVIVPNISLDVSRPGAERFWRVSLPASLQQAQPFGPIFSPAEDQDAQGDHHDAHAQEDADGRQLVRQPGPVEQAAPDAGKGENIFMVFSKSAMFCLPISSSPPNGNSPPKAS